MDPNQRGKFALLLVGGIFVGPWIVMGVLYLFAAAFHYGNAALLNIYGYPSRSEAAGACLDRKNARNRGRRGWNVEHKCMEEETTRQFLLMNKYKEVVERFKY